jgi:hypothetical protein
MRRAAVVAVAMLAIGGLAACGDDDDDEAAAPADDDVKEYCDATLAIETVEEPDIDFEGPEAEVTAGVKKFAAETLRPLADRIVAAAPEEVKADIDVLSGSVDELAATGSEEAFEKPEVEEASDNAHAFDLENCDWGRVDATALDYAFDGISDEVDAGAVSFELKNDGEEVHEMSIVRKAPGTTETFDQLLEMEEEEVGDKIVDVAHVGPTKPGDNDYAVANLEAGEYLVACFFPVGSTPEKYDAEEEVDGPPHFTRGMKKEFKVA